MGTFYPRFAKLLLQGPKVKFIKNYFFIKVMYHLDFETKIED